MKPESSELLSARLDAVSLLLVTLVKSLDRATAGAVLASFERNAEGWAATLLMSSAPDQYREHFQAEAAALAAKARDRSGGPPPT